MWENTKTSKKKVDLGGIEKYRETLDRYKRFYPENCEGRTDIEILIYRKLITPEEAERIVNYVAPVKKVRKPSGKKIAKPSMKELYLERVEVICDNFKEMGCYQLLTKYNNITEMANNLLENHEELRSWFKAARVKSDIWTDTVIEYLEA